MHEAPRMMTDWSLLTARILKAVLTNKLGEMQSLQQFVLLSIPKEEVEKHLEELLKDFTAPVPSERGYKNQFISGELNQAFWREVLEGRTIKEVVFGENGMECLVLDDDQRFFINNPSHPAGCVWIKD